MALQAKQGSSPTENRLSDESLSSLYRSIDQLSLQQKADLARHLLQIPGLRVGMAEPSVGAIGQMSRFEF